VVATSPVHQGRSASHSMESKPSRPSFRYGTNSPSESPRPRTSIHTNAYPASANRVAVLWAGSPFLL